MLFTGLIILVGHITLSSTRQANCDERGPICGNDGKTYPNMCQLIWARLEDTDLAVLHEGSCNGKYLTSMLQQSEGDAVKKKSRNVVMNLKRPRIDYDKIRAVMPVGWPPLGPIISSNKPLRIPKSRKRPQINRKRKHKNKSIVVVA